MLLLFGCVPGSQGAATPASPRWVEETFTAETDADGQLAVSVEVGEDEDAFMVVGERDEAYINSQYVADPDGEVRMDWHDWNDEDRLTDGVFLTSWATTVAWPPRAADGPLTPGTWTVTLGAWDLSDEPEAGASLEVTVLRRKKSDVAVLPVHIAYADGVGDDDAVVEATESAVELWRDIYAQAGIELEVTYGTIGVDDQLPYALEGDEAYETLFAERDPRALLIVVGERIEDTAWYGESPSVPGAFTPTRLSAMELSWLTLAGGNGFFSEDEIAIFGVTLAHEVGHYLGLFHPVQLAQEEGSVPTAWDSLDDTPRCEDYDTCIEDLADNLMFPFPQCERRDCEPATALTEDQIAVLRGYVGVGADPSR